MHTELKIAAKTDRHRLDVIAIMINLPPMQRSEDRMRDYIIYGPCMTHATTGCKHTRETNGQYMNTCVKHIRAVLPFMNVGA